LNGTVAKVKGFGGNTQQKILDSLAFLKDQAGETAYGQSRGSSAIDRGELKKTFGQVEAAGEIRRKSEVVETIRILAGTDSPALLQNAIGAIELLVQDEKISSPFVWRGHVQDVAVAIEIVAVKPERLVNELFLETAGADHLGLAGTSGSTIWRHAYYETADTEHAIYEKAGLPYIVPEMREGAGEFAWAETRTPDQLVTWDDLRGILHNHSTYSRWPAHARTNGVVLPGIRLRISRYRRPFPNRNLRAGTEGRRCDPSA
jgi:DNA polymerase (family 10)